MRMPRVVLPGQPGAAAPDVRGVGNNDWSADTEGDDASS